MKARYLEKRQALQNRLHAITVAAVCIAMAITAAGHAGAADASAPGAKAIDNVGIVRRVQNSIVQIKAILIVKTTRHVITRIAKPILNRRGKVVTYTTTKTQTRTTTVTTTSGGSGVIIDRAGDIVTNLHVVYGARTIEVTLADHRHYAASLVGSDPRADLAVVRIHAHDLQAARFGNSSRLNVGQEVLDFGAPFNFGGSVTQGIISALHRHNISLTGETDPHLNLIRHEDFIQTDAPSDPGSSGGALVDMNSKVVGINDSIKSGGAGSFSGVGFTIPANEVRFVTSHIIKDGRVIHGHAGFQAATSFVRLHRHGKLRIVDGIRITAVKTHSAAATAGIKVGDLIVAIDGRRVKQSAQLMNRIMFSAPGTLLHLQMLRGGRTLDISLKVAAKGNPH